jgi:uncharacterized protein (TIGR01777 family)
MPDQIPNQHVIIAGGSGFIGVSLALHLATANYDVIILSRHAPKPVGPWRHVPWDARTLGDWRQSLDGAAALINLVGRSVDCIKTPDHQDEILRSRLEATHILGQALRTSDAPPPVWIQMSTAHIYGDPPEVICTEDSPFGAGFAPFVGRAWEDAFNTAALPSQRKVMLRTSFVVGRDRGAGGGALARLKTLVRLGLGGRVGTGKQGMSWIHEQDLNRLFERAIIPLPSRERPGEGSCAAVVRGSPDPAPPATAGLNLPLMPPMQGPYIATAPNPVSQLEFMRELRRAMHIPIALPATAWMVRLGAPLLLRTDPELALYGRYLKSSRLETEGFQFRFPELRAALTDLISPARA